LDTELAKIHDPFLKESLMLAIDGVERNRPAQDDRELHSITAARKTSAFLRSSSPRPDLLRTIGIYWSGAGADPGNAAPAGH